MTLRREIAAVVAADVLRDGSTHEEVAEPFEHVLAREIPGDIDCKALSRVLVHDRQPPESTAFRRVVHGEVVAPDVVSMLWPQPDARAIVVVVWHGLLWRGTTIPSRPSQPPGSHPAGGTATAPSPTGLPAASSTVNVTTFEPFPSPHAIASCRAWLIARSPPRIPGMTLVTVTLPFEVVRVR